MTTGKSYKLCVDLDGMDLMFIFEFWCLHVESSYIMFNIISQLTHDEFADVCGCFSHRIKAGFQRFQPFPGSLRDLAFVDTGPCGSDHFHYRSGKELRMAEGQKRKWWLDDDWNAMRSKIVLRCFFCSGFFSFLLIFITFISFIGFRSVPTYNCGWSDGFGAHHKSCRWIDGASIWFNADPMHIETEEVGAGMQGMNKTQSESGFEKGRSWRFLSYVVINDVYLYLCISAQESRLPQAYGYVGAECSTSFAQNIFTAWIEFRDSCEIITDTLKQLTFLSSILCFYSSIIICRSGVLLPFAPRAFSASAGERNTVVSLAWTLS